MATGGEAIPICTKNPKMAVNALLNVPKSANDWNIWSQNNREELTRIRQAIQAVTGNVIEIITTSNGSGYTSAPAVTINDTTGTGALAYATYSVSDNEYSIIITVTAEGKGYTNPTVTLTGGGGSGATAEVDFSPIINLPEYQLDPIDFSDVQNWLSRNQESHDDFNGALGLNGVDLEGVDLTDPKQTQDWIYLVWQEIQIAQLQLGI